jgi:DNA-binding response OmpR family regulator
MDTHSEIEGRQILIVDDEKDVLYTLTELLDVMKVDTASSFDEGKRLLESNPYNIAVQDIIGVKGFELRKERTYRL